MVVGDDLISDRFGGHFAGWSDEDVIRAYLVNQLRKVESESEVKQLEYMTPMRPMFTSSSQLAGYRSISHGLLEVSLSYSGKPSINVFFKDGVEFLLDLYRKWKRD